MGWADISSQHPHRHHSPPRHTPPHHTPPRHTPPDPPPFPPTPFPPTPFPSPPLLLFGTNSFVLVSYVCIFLDFFLLYLIFGLF